MVKVVMMRRREEGYKVVEPSSERHAESLNTVRTVTLSPVPQASEVIR